MLKTLPELIAETTAHVRILDSATARTEHAANGGYLIDVREPVEAQQKAPAGSHNIPRGILEIKITELCPEATHHIYLHCASGGRARLAAEQLLRMGYHNVTAISCGVDDICLAFEDD